MAIYDAVYSGIPVRISWTIDSTNVIGEFMPDIPVMERPYQLRSTYEGPQFDVIARAMAGIAEAESTRSRYTGHTAYCAAHVWLDEGDCDCY